MLYLDRSFTGIPLVLLWTYIYSIFILSTAQKMKFSTEYLLVILNKFAMIRGLFTLTTEQTSWHKLLAPLLLTMNEFHVLLSCAVNTQSMILHKTSNFKPSNYKNRYTKTNFNEFQKLESLFKFASDWEKSLDFWKLL